MTVKFFASLREQLGIAEQRIAIAPGATVTDVWIAVVNRPLDAAVLSAVNLAHAEPRATVRDGDEVAFFPPVTGG